MSHLRQHLHRQLLRPLHCLAVAGLSNPQPSSSFLHQHAEEEAPWTLLLLLLLLHHHPAAALQRQPLLLLPAAAAGLSLPSAAAAWAGAGALSQGPAALFAGEPPCWGAALRPSACLYTQGSVEHSSTLSV